MQSSSQLAAAILTAIVLGVVAGPWLAAFLWRHTDPPLGCPRHTHDDEPLQLAAVVPFPRVSDPALDQLAEVLADAARNAARDGAA